MYSRNNIEDKAGLRLLGKLACRWIPKDFSFFFFPPLSSEPGWDANLKMYDRMFQNRIYIKANTQNSANEGVLEIGS
jgi:hypothetical protein